jgi:hypothetical protein
MSTNGADITEKVQLPIFIGNSLSPAGSSASRGLPVVFSEGARQQLPVTTVDPCMSASLQGAPAAFAGFGYGGRSGAIATVACAFFVELASLYGADDKLFHADRADLADVNLGSLGPNIAACLTGTMVGLLTLRRGRVAAADLADRTFVASVSALIGLIFVHLISPADARPLDGRFLGMSSRERLNGWIEAVLGAVVLTSLIIQAKAVHTLRPPYRYKQE